MEKVASTFRTPEYQKAVQRVRLTKLGNQLIEAKKIKDKLQIEKIQKNIADIKKQMMEREFHEAEAEKYEAKFDI